MMYVYLFAQTQAILRGTQTKQEISHKQVSQLIPVNWKIGKVTSRKYSQFYHEKKSTSLWSYEI